MDFEKDKFGLFNLATAIRAPTTPFHSRGSKFNLSRGEHDVCKVMTFLSVLALPPFFIELAAADATRAAAAAFSSALLLSSSTLFSIASKVSSL